MTGKNTYLFNFFDALVSPLPSNARFLSPIVVAETWWSTAGRNELSMSVTRDAHPDTDVLSPHVDANQGQRRLRRLSFPVFALALVIYQPVTLLLWRQVPTSARPKESQIHQKT